jgi:hypothetical protein
MGIRLTLKWTLDNRFQRIHNKGQWRAFGIIGFIRGDDQIRRISYNRPCTVTGWMSGVLFPVVGRIFLFVTACIPDLGNQPASYPKGTGGKAAEARSWLLTSIWCRGLEYIKNYTMSDTRLHDVALKRMGSFMFWVWSVWAMHARYFTWNPK